jgi:hypothetical protein
LRARHNYRYSSTGTTTDTPARRRTIKACGAFSLDRIGAQREPGQGADLLERRQRAEVVESEPGGVVDLVELGLDAMVRGGGRARRELTGRDLACWCEEHEPRHAHVWLDVLSRP